MKKEQKGEPAFWVPPLFDAEGNQVSSAIGTDGREIPDSVPMEIPVEYQKAGPDLMELIKSVVHSSFLRQKADEEGFDTPEEADDFSDDEDDQEITPYQRMVMEADLNPDPAVAQTQPAPAAHSASRAPQETGEGVGTPSPSSVSKTDVSDVPQSSEGVGVGTQGKVKAAPTGSL